MSAVDVVVARLREMLPADVPVFDGGPDDGVARFVLVTGNVGTVESLDLAQSAGKRDPVVWVTCTAEYPKGPGARSSAAWQAGWLAEKVQAALVGWRPDALSWKPVHINSAPPTRDEDRPDAFTYYTVDTYGLSRIA